MEPVMPDLSCFVSVEHQLCLHPSNQNFYRFNSDYTDSDKMMHTIINFLNDEKLHISKWDIKRTLNVTKDQWEACDLSKMLVLYKLCIYHKSSMGVWDIVTVCSYHELSVECVHPKITLKQLLRVMSQPYRPLSRMCIKASKRESICCVSCSIPLEFMNLKRSFYEYKKDVCKS
jgi:hypothetical protein